MRQFRRVMASAVACESACNVKTMRRTEAPHSRRPHSKALECGRRLCGASVLRIVFTLHALSHATADAITLRNWRIKRSRRGWGGWRRFYLVTMGHVGGKALRQVRRDTV